jgi:kynurenine formamidase
VQDWDKNGGIVGRGVLLDYCSWMESKGVPYNPMSKHVITLADLMAIARDQGVTFSPGDILLIRTGWIKWYEENNEEQRLRYVTNGSAWVGVEGCQEVLEWLWNQHFAAVAGDSIGWEAWPPKAGYGEICFHPIFKRADIEFAELHDHLLSLWGMPIGEMWDLEALAKECEKHQRWSFFLTSAPLNTAGGVASPPNSLAIF